jgi:hypothetical protein
MYVCMYVCMYKCGGQGCQIFLGTTYQIRGKFTKLSQHKLNGHQIYQMAVKYIKYTNIFHCKTLRIFRKLVFLFLKYTIWQPRSRFANSLR